MLQRTLFGVAIATALSVPLWTLAADDSAVQQSSSSSTQDLERRIQVLEDQLNERASTSAPTSPSAFNPAIALVLSGVYTHLSQDPEAYRIQGFIPGGEETGPGSKGFSLGESELTLSATIDPTFFGALTFALGGDDSVAVEEAKVETMGLAHGINLKFGRFLSSLGYLNGQHAHSWDFVDAPLVYQAFFGGQYKNDGLQLRWLAPTERFFELGAEVGTGSAFPGSELNRNGFGVTTVFARLADDIGSSASWQGNAWYQRSRADGRSYGDEDSTGSSVSNAFAGHSATWGVGAVYKWSPNGKSSGQNLKLQAEFIQRKESGDLTYDTQGQSLGTATAAYRSSQSGWYGQAVYQFIKRWRAGLRYEQLDSGSVDNGLVAGGSLTADDFPRLAAYRPQRSSIMLDYSPSEFSRLRLQLSQDQAGAGGSDAQVFLQYVMSLGAHGAHSY